MWQEFTRALEDLSDAYTALLAIGSRKRAVLVAVDLKGLEPLVEEEEQQLERIRAAENRRRDALLALSKTIPSAHSALTMAEVESACPTEFRPALRAANRRLTKQVNAVKEAGEFNEFLIRQALGAVEYHLNRLSNSSIDPTYGQTGSESASQEKKFDFQA